MTGDENANSVPLTAHLVVLMSPVAEPSSAAIRPSSLTSMFSSPCETMTVLSFTTTPVLMARLAATKLHTFSPVCGLMAWMAPSPRPAISSRRPLMVAIIGAA